MYSGTITASNGISIVAITNSSRNPLRGKSSREKKYAPIVLNTSELATTPAETSAVLISARPKFNPKDFPSGEMPSTSWKFFNDHSTGTNVCHVNG